MTKICQADLEVLDSNLKVVASGHGFVSRLFDGFDAILKSAAVIDDHVNAFVLVRPKFRDEFGQCVNKCLDAGELLLDITHALLELKMLSSPKWFFNWSMRRWFTTWREARGVAR